MLGGVCARVLVHTCTRTHTYTLPPYTYIHGCAGGFCSVLLVWNLLGGPHESGYIYLLPQSSPLAQCCTATNVTCTTQTRLCSVPLWTDDLWGALWRRSFSVGPSGDWTPDHQRERQSLHQLAILTWYSHATYKESKKWPCDVEPGWSNMGCI